MAVNNEIESPPVAPEPAPVAAAAAPRRTGLGALSVAAIAVGSVIVAGALFGGGVLVGSQVGGGGPMSHGSHSQEGGPGMGMDRPGDRDGNRQAPQGGQGGQAGPGLDGPGQILPGQADTNTGTSTPQP